MNDCVAVCQSACRKVGRLEGWKVVAMGGVLPLCVQGYRRNTVLRRCLSMSLDRGFLPFLEVWMMESSDFTSLHPVGLSWSKPCTPEQAPASTGAARTDGGGSQNLFNVFWEIALECNRNEWMLRMRCMGSCPCKQPGRPIARFHSNPSGKCLAGQSAALRRLPIAELLAAHRALHPIPARYLCDPEKILNRF